MTNYKQLNKQGKELCNLIGKAVFEEIENSHKTNSILFKISALMIGNGHFNSNLKNGFDSNIYFWEHQPDVEKLSRHIHNKKIEKRLAASKKT